MRWLTFDELCTELKLNQRQVKTLIKSGKLVGLCYGRRNRVTTDWRWADPGEKYARALKLLADMHSRSLALDIGEFPVLGSAEFAELCGFSESRVRGLIHRGVLLPYKMGRYSLFTPNQVRDYLFRREKLELAPARARMRPVLDWCQRRVAADRALTLTQAEVHADDALEGTLQALLRLKEPARAKAVKEFWRRYRVAAELAKIAQT